MAIRTGYEEIEAGAEELLALRNLKQLIAESGDGNLSLVDSVGNRVQLPDSAVRLLNLGVELLANQEHLHMQGDSQVITVEDAADKLGLPVDYVREMVIRRHLLLDIGTNPEQIRHSDFLNIQRQEESLRFLSVQGQTLNHLLETGEPYDFQSDDKSRERQNPHQTIDQVLTQLSKLMPEFARGVRSLIP